YLRYMDDVKVMAKDIHVAREALFLMNEKLRELRLNIQGAKTRILQGDEIRDELFDNRLDEVNAVIAEIQDKNNITPAERKSLVGKLKTKLKAVKGRKGVIRDKELRLFRRLITGFTLLRNSSIVRITLDQLERNPDSRLLNSAVRYLRSQDRNLNRISDRISSFLIDQKLLFPYQNAHCLMTLRYQRDLQSLLWREAKRRLKNKKEHWYVRQQAALLIGLKNLSKKELESLRKLAFEEEDAKVKRALGQALAQLPQQELFALSKELLFEINPEIQRLGRYYYDLLFDNNRAKEQIKYLFRDFREEVLIDRLYEAEVLSKANYSEIRVEVRNRLNAVIRNLRRPILQKRVASIIDRIDKEAGMA
ncbi:MAG TPA: hypothetical protein VJ044_12925, partial [Candidatus Hodarchaeales archaeon]|nr:hypothetical protein [Candidatus Hodarchaeales archaeon]